MGLTKLTAFEGEAVVMGELVRVEWDSHQGVGGFTINNVSLEMAEAILDALKTDRIYTVKPSSLTAKPAPGSAADRPPKDEATVKDVYAQGVATGLALGKAEATGTKVGEEPKPTPPPTPEAPKEDEKAGKRARKLTPIKDVAEPTAGAQAASEAPPPAGTTPTPPKEAPVPAKAAETPPAGNGAADIPEGVKKAKRMLEVVDWLATRGITEEVAIVAECERLRPEIPVLARTPDMKDRVKSTLLAFKELGGAAK
jgi:hypothetical protein